MSFDEQVNGGTNPQAADLFAVFASGGAPGDDGGILEMAALVHRESLVVNMTADKRINSVGRFVCRRWRADSPGRGGRSERG